MRFLLVSDVHKSFRIYRNYNESVAVEWLLNVIDRVKPEVLISAGDWDDGMTPNDFLNIMSKVKKLLTVYGNHENFPLIEGYVMHDGKVYEVGGLKIAGINGLIGEGSKKGIPMTSPTRFRNALYRIKKAVDRLDILVMHQPPYLPEVYPEMSEDEGSALVYQGIEELKPRLFFNGHMTQGCYTFHNFQFQTKYLRVDSSQLHKCYGVLESNSRELTVYQEEKEVFKMEF
ncbi:metallophosphoesterase family protein [Sulfolobus acidocaldarius]|uniref:Calcineurin-like phosphoesterase domain-containing protein n=4 Tax=Sulfolobus acidocaldarius TaxID=2285 RepID=Q4J9P6_SULAC|nr:metallophosphoesterase family protein [Sulfolobus acidocaldarius]AAY80484.1 hypothetical protein Saci_1132 [Sulfolobus acidocaldarius DSM 639]AGE71069.1 hypothetical protein SacN8_05510 [Sulfolobus acidocaldarius N8]AGE73340.1 hypothetical protein SacRon12I_05500 [Sulfolobus acidocaldarius Ron12/I]ALU28650.1 metallophosphoesterase [Sulfolobus acidocaldarius]ALU31365.1 metallophosphoesterase [Sulfolobus acidocaldarius]